MANKDITESLRHVLNLIYEHGVQLELPDVRHVHKLQNWLRERDDRPTSAAKMKGNSKLQNLDRGITI